MIPRVDIGIACSAHQTPSWWGSVFTNLLRETGRGTFEMGQLFAHQSAMPDSNKNHTVGGVLIDPALKGRNEKTDVNRQFVTGYFLEGGETEAKADWLFWMDDDTTPPDGTITRLLRMDKPFVAGLYFNANPPYNPIAYNRLDNGGYRHIWGFSPGSVMQVDCVGMGCTLIHRSVYEKIIEEHVVFQRPDASLMPIHKSKISNTRQGMTIPQVVNGAQTCVHDSYLVMKLIEPELSPDPKKNKRLFPFYIMEQGRTEDMYFCELAASVGIKPWVDTSIVCDHWKARSYSYEDYRKEYVRREIDGGSEEDK